MEGKQSRRAVLRQLATGSIVGSAALGAVGSATANDGQGKPTIRIRPFVRSPTVSISYLRKQGPTALLQIRDAETGELVDEVTLEPGTSEINGYSAGVYTAEAQVANDNEMDKSQNAIEVEGSPFELNEYVPL